MPTKVLECTANIVIIQCAGGTEIPKLFKLVNKNEVYLTEGVDSVYQKLKDLNEYGIKS